MGKLTPLWICNNFTNAYEAALGPYFKSLFVRLRTAVLMKKTKGRSSRGKMFPRDNAHTDETAG